MSYEFNNNAPLYLQIVNIITKEIVSGIIKPGDKIPSVREYALIFKVNIFSCYFNCNDGISCN